MICSRNFFALILLGSIAPAWEAVAGDSSAHLEAEGTRLLNSGKAHFSKGQYEQAIEDFSTAMKFSPHPFIYVTRAMAWKQLNDADNGIADCNRAIEIDPNISAAYATRAFCHVLNKNDDAAIADFTTAIQLEPNIGYFVARARLWQKQGKYEQMLDDLNNAIELEPENAELYVMRSTAGRWIGGIEHTIRDCERAIALDEKLTTAYVICGYAQMELGQFEKALECFEHAHFLEPRQAVVIHALAKLLANSPEAELLDFKRAIQLAKALCELNNQSWQSLQFVAELYAKSGDFESAVEWQSHSLKIAPEPDKPEIRKTLKRYEALRDSA